MTELVDIPGEKTSLRHHHHPTVPAKSQSKPGRDETKFRELLHEDLFPVRAFHEITSQKKNENIHTRCVLSDMKEIKTIQVDEETG